MLASAKRRARGTLLTQRASILAAFKARLGTSAFVYEEAQSMRRIDAAVFMDERDCERRAEREDEIYGETDGNQIWINPWCDSMEMERTLLHEALHDAVKLERPTRSGDFKTLTENAEHAVMQELPYCI